MPGDLQEITREAASVFAGLAVDREHSEHPQDQNGSADQMQNQGDVRQVRQRGEAQQGSDRKHHEGGDDEGGRRTQEETHRGDDEGPGGKGGRRATVSLLHGHRLRVHDSLQKPQHQLLPVSLDHLRMSTRKHIHHLQILQPGVRAVLEDYQ